MFCYSIFCGTIKRQNNNITREYVVQHNIPIAISHKPPDDDYAEKKNIIATCEICVYLYVREYMEPTPVFDTYTDKHFYI